MIPLHRVDTVHPPFCETPFDLEAVRRDFPILNRLIHGKPLVYLDNAASTQKPQSVIDIMTDTYSGEYANVHRGVYWLSERATDLFEGARESVRSFINAGFVEEIIFVRGATEAINLVATSFGGETIRSGDEILLTEMEHHANIVPWYQLAKRVGATLKVAPVTDRGELDLDAYRALLSDKTRIVAVTHVSNALGTINPIKQMIEDAHARGIPVLVDGAQGIPHGRVDVQALDCDFYAFSGHKLFGPTGIGVLYGKKKHLNVMPPYQGGGDMIETVSFDKITWNALPYKFEAGTPDIVGAIGLGAAIDYLQHLNWEAAERHEARLLEYASARFAELKGVRIIGTASKKVGVISFTIEGAHPHDIGTILDRSGIAIRAGHHCAQPLMARFGVPATARASFAFYNTLEEVDLLIDGIQKVMKLFA